MGLLLALAVGVVLVASLVLAAAYPLIDPDEGRNAEVGREMLARGDFVVPHLAGMPYLDKPPALFWAEAAAFGIFGTTAFAARLPAALAAAAILWLLGTLAAHRAPSRMLTVVALTASSPLFFMLSAYVIFDMLLALCVTVIWVNLAREVSGGGAVPRAGVLRRVAMFLALGFGVLVKGPVMLAWGIGGSLAAAGVQRSRKPLGWLAWWPGWGLFLLLAGGWFVLAVVRHPEYPGYAFVDETFRRMTTGAFQREQPWWFVPAVLAGGALPWSLATPWGRGLGPISRVALGFVLFAAVFFTLSRSKLVTYVLPVLPCMAWMAAEAWGRAERARRGAIGAAATLAAVAAAGLAFGSAPALWGTRIAPDVVATGRVGAAAIGWIIAAGALLAAVAAWRRNRWLALAPCVAFTPIVLLAAGPVLVRHADTQSGAPLAQAIERVHPEARVVYERTYSPGTDFELGRGARIVSATGLETTSNYQVFHRETLMARGQWKLLTVADGLEDADVLVRPAGGGDAPAPQGWLPFFRDRRFIAYHRAGVSR